MNAGHSCPLLPGDDPENYLCVEGRIYGPCDYPTCGGGCEYKDDCRCACHDGKVA